MEPIDLTFRFNTLDNTIPKRKKLFVVDDFYANPDEIRNFALTQVVFREDLRYYKGMRSTKPYRPEGLKEIFEGIIGEKITNWDNYGTNGCFQICTAADPQVYHYDTQKWAAMVYLSPNAPTVSGTSLLRSRVTGSTSADQPATANAFVGGFYDSTKFEVIDTVGNVYNRLIIMDSRNIHAAGPYFGQDKLTGRLTHLFFFD